jgi:uncharacterized coiled-coil DUF342 family protein
MSYDYGARDEARSAHREARDARSEARSAREEARRAQKELEQLRKDFAAAALRIKKLEEALAPKTLDKKVTLSVPKKG